MSFYIYFDTRFIFIIILEFGLSEYQIKENVIPSYLSYSFNNLSEDIFPNDIIISISLSRVDGTLLYSLDSNNNQLIVSLSDADVPTLTVEFSKQEFSISIPKLCGVERGKYETIKLRIQIKKEFIHLQCNEAMIESFKYQRSSIINKDYPIHKMKKGNKLEAHLWLVNTPSFGDILYNGAQLSGCIFDVWYNNKIINMESHNMKNTCPRTCVPGICHSGTCLETYNIHPVCNCTSSFKNGRFCNENIKSQNHKVSQQFNFKVVKLSFNSKSQNLLELNNTRVSLKVFVNGNDLILKINCDNKGRTTIESVISQNYQNEQNNIVILVFNEKSVEIKFSSNGSSWSFMYLPYYHDLSREIFETLVLQSEEGIIDMAYKNDLTAIRWNKLAYVDEKMVNNLPKMANYRKYIQNSKLKVREKSQVQKIDFEMQLYQLDQKVNACVGLLILSLVILSFGMTIILKYHVKFKKKTLNMLLKKDKGNNEDV